MKKRIISILLVMAMTCGLAACGGSGKGGNGDKVELRVATWREFDKEYYEEIERKSMRPMEIYPNFLEAHVYTGDGIPFVTAMQNPCNHFRLKSKECDEGEDNTCYQCAYYEKCEELLGLCKCKARYKKLE